MPWVEKNGSGWRGVWRGPEGKAKGPTFAAKVEAEDWLRANGPRTEVTALGQILDLWQGFKRSDYARNVTVQLLREFRLMGWTNVGQITPASVAAWHAKKEGRGVAKYTQDLLTVLRWVHRTHQVPVREDVLSMRPPKLPRRPKPPLLTDEQVEAIRECSWTYGPRAAALIDYLLTYGARPITAARLKLRDLDVERRTLCIENAKHSGGWRHPVTDRHALWWYEVASFFGADGPLFPHYKENRAWRIDCGKANEMATWFRNTIGKRLKLPREANGIYHLKRWAITRMLRSGLDPATVALFTGHKDLDQVLTYNVTNEERAISALATLLAKSS